jgi:hypothetical protein
MLTSRSAGVVVTIMAVPRDPASALAAVMIGPARGAGLIFGYYTLSPLWERSHLEETSPQAGTGRWPRSG